MCSSISRGREKTCQTWFTTYLLVGSSRINTLPGFNKARARQKSCRWPCESNSASINASRTSPTPRPDAFLLASLASSELPNPTLCSALVMSSSDACFAGSRLDLTEALNRKGSWSGNSAFPEQQALAQWPNRCHLGIFSRRWCEIGEEGQVWWSFCRLVTGGMSAQDYVRVFTNYIERI